MIWWKIRPYEQQDYEAVCQILSDGLEYQQSVNKKSNYRDETIDAFKDDLLNNPKNRWWVALDGEQVIGVMLMDITVDHKNFRQRCVLIEELDVHRSYQRRSVGSCLVDYAEYVAMSKDIRLVSARAHYGNIASRDFYLARGFNFSDIPDGYGFAPSRAISFHKRLPD